jgi:hypothetical protein
VILDDFSHFTWNFPLRRKSDVASTLHSFYAYVATHFHHTIAHLQTDNGKEFDNLAIRNVLSTHGTIFVSPVLTHHSKTVVPNVFFAHLMRVFMLCFSMQTCLHDFGQMLLLPPHFFSTFGRANRG